ncbi:MAG: hypothetical protein IT462_08500 [Planctomycetes bacterium]|nr:hypothetical protein [Planctomycetota bacterium]
MGCFCGGAQIVVTTIKMPLFFVLTLGLCFSLMHVTQLVGGLKLRANQTLTVALSGLTVQALSLGSLAPVLALFAANAPFPAMSSYLNLYVACALAGLIAGVFGATRLALGLRMLAPVGRGTRLVLAAWIFIYQFVGAQVAWTLRPWLGATSDFTNYYSLEHGLSGNFYVGVGAVVLRWLKELGMPI